MFKSIRSKIAFPVIGILVLLVVFNVLYVSYSLHNFSDERSEERILGASQAAQAYLAQLESYSRMTARALAGDQGIIDLVIKYNEGERTAARDGLYDYLAEHMDSLGIALSVVMGSDGNVILRTHDPLFYGDPGIISPIMAAAFLYGEVTTSYTATTVTPMVLSSAAPIYRDGEIIGAISAMRSLGTLEFVDTFGEIFNAEVSIFSGYTSVATTIYIDRETGERAIDVPAQEHVIRQVLLGNEPFDDQIEIAGTLHHGFYFPLIGWGGVPSGMFFIGFSIEEAVSATERFIRNLAMVGAVALILAATVMIFGITLNANRVSRLAKIVEDIANGGEYKELPRARKDEVGVLTRSISALMDKIKELSSSRTIVEIKEYIAETETHAIEAEAASKAKSEFLSTMSHEIRTPIGVIMGITEIHLRRASCDSDAKEAFEKIYVSGGMLLGIINDILDLSKIEAGKMELTIEKYEVASMVGDTAQLNILRVSGKPINFIVDAQDSIPSHLYGDELRIKQILNNILSNAFKYTDEGTIKLTVSHKPDGDNALLVFSVSDTGIGMTQEQVGAMFDEFTRFNVSANREAEGTGLGMSIVKSLVKMMDGEIFVESEPGKGSVFTVEIPQKIADNTPIGSETAENLRKFKYAGQLKLIQTEWEPMPYGKILVVDDIDANIYVARGYLEPYGLEVDAAESGAACIEKIENGETYDLIFLDHMMPQMDGLETIRILREMDYDGPVCAFTANALVGHEERFLSRGFDAFLSKPIQSTVLDEILKKYVRDRKPPEIVQAARNAAGEFKTSKTNYAELYDDFAKSQSGIIPEIRDVLKNGDFGKAILLAHTLKSLAGLIGENELMNLAAKTEASLRKKTGPEELLDLLSNELDRVLASIAEKAAEPMRLPPLLPHEAKKVLENLNTLLEQNNAEVITLLPALRAIEGTEEIISDIEKYNFASALEKLSRFNA